MFKELKDIINDILKDKKYIISEIAKKASEFSNPKDIIQKLTKAKGKLEEVNDEISRILDEGMLLISRGVQDEESLKGHLEKHYSEKNKLIQEIEELEGSLISIRKIREEKLTKSLESMEYPVKELTQKEIGVFIKEIVVYKDHLQITAMTSKVYTISNDRVK